MDPRESFISNVIVSEARVRSYAGFVFLCGGKINSSTAPFLSVRHRLHYELTSGQSSDVAARIRLAEDIKDWYQNGVYRDLVTFESDLAALASVIVLIVESPGAIAELGVFTVVPQISEKLVIVIEEGHFDSDSYIKHGPVKKFEVDTGKQALVHSWLRRSFSGLESFDPLVIEEHIREIADFVIARARVPVSEVALDKDDPQHVMLMIVELCALFGALNESDICRYLDVLSISVPPARARQLLWLLTQCGLLVAKARSNGRYYTAPYVGSALISFRVKPGYAFNRERLVADVAEFYREKMPTRFAVLRSVASATRVTA